MGYSEVVEASDRLTRARQIADEKRNALIASAAPPCSTCVHRLDVKIDPGGMTFAIHCNHVAVAVPRYDSVAGRLTIISQPADRARHPEGLCGPEGVLHEKRPGLWHEMKWWTIGYTALMAGGLAFVSIAFGR